MVDILRKNPAVVVDVCLGRLHQKVGEWEKDQARMGEIWQKMYDTNYHKSLDHRSFYFKQVTPTPVCRISALGMVILSGCSAGRCGSQDSPQDCL